MDVQGLWTGTVIYGKEYRNLKGQAMHFEMEIFQTGNRIHGNANDIHGTGTSPDTATIQGEISEKEINFIKQYKSTHYYNKGTTRLDKSKPGPEIKYSGCFDEKENIFKGEWILHGTFKLLGLIPIKYINTGTWIMKKK
jgi:hypothetical protein